MKKSTKKSVSLLIIIPYDSPSSVHFQIGIGAPKWHLFDWQFCVGVLQTVAERTRQNSQILTPAQCAAKHSRFQEGSICLLFGPHPLITVLPAFWATSLITIMKNQYLHYWLQFELQVNVVVGRHCSHLTLGS